MDNKNELHTQSDGLLPFDPIVLIMDVAKRWLVVVLAALVAWVGTYIYADMSYEPVYRTSTTFVVTTRSSTASVYSNLSSANSLATVFSDILNSSILRKEILSELGTNSFDGTIEASVIPETNLLMVTVTASDPSTAFRVIRAVIDHHETVTYQVVSGISLEVLQAPTVPMGPINSSNAAGSAQQMMKIAAIGATALLAVVCFQRDTVRGSQEARRKLDCTYLGEIPHERKRKTLGAWLRRRKSGILISNPTTSFRYVESMRKLRRRVEQKMHSDKVLLVTSLLENEGKSTVAANLAISMAQKYERVLLIDCDLRKPACHVLLEHREFEHGLLDVLTEKSSFDDAVVIEPHSGLNMLLERQREVSSGDLLSSRKMRDLLDMAREEFDFVVLDLPPMAEVSDAETVMDLADASLLVVRQNVATAPVLNKTIGVLEQGKAKLLGCVLNNVYTSSLSNGQNFGYGKYGHYGSYGHYDSGTTPARREGDSNGL